MIKITPFTLKCHAFLYALKLLPLTFKISYYEIYNRTLKAYRNNPNIKW